MATLYLAHHGIKGQEWGKRNGPPYPLDAEDHSTKEKRASGKQSHYRGWDMKNTQGKYGYANKYGDMSYARVSSKKMYQNSDGSWTVPSGYVFNRVAKRMDTKANRLGAVYVSSGERDAASYINSVSISPVDNVINPLKCVQHIEVDEDMRQASDSETEKELLNYAAKHPDMIEAFNNSKQATTTGVGKITDSEIKLAAKNPTVGRSRSIVWGLYSTFGLSEKFGDYTGGFYDHMRKKGYDAIPDLYDKYTNNGLTSTIILNQNKMHQYDTTIVNSDMIHAGQRYITAMGGWVPPDDIIMPVLTRVNYTHELDAKELAREIEKKNRTNP